VTRKTDALINAMKYLVVVNLGKPLYPSVSVSLSVNEGNKPIVLISKTLCEAHKSQQCTLWDNKSTVSLRL
jgi:hypothetical protein